MKSNFYNWAVSFAGCDGGNLKMARTWFCGLEWGYKDGNESEKRKYYKSISLSISRNETSTFNSEFYNFSKHQNQFGRFITEIYSSIYNFDKNDHSNFNKSDIFKINLYPIAFRDISEELYQKYMKDYLQFKSKLEYKQWCMLNRFPFLAEKAKESSSLERIICIGTSHVNEFLSAFGNISPNFEKQVVVEELSSDSPTNLKPKKFYWLKIDINKFLYIIPFYSSQNGFNEEILRYKFGQRVKEIESEQNENL